MSEKAKIIYTDSRGNEWDLMVDNMRRIKTANFHDYSWQKDVSTKRFGERLRAWSKDAVQYSVTILFDGSNREELLNNFHDALEYDIINVTPGILSWEEYSIECYGISSKTYPAESGTASSTANDVIFYCPSPWWTKVISFSSYTQKDIGNVKVYIVGSTPFDEGWLSTEQGGDPLSPVDGTIYVCQTTGEYYEHQFVWNGERYLDLTPEFIKNYDMAYDYAYDYMTDYNSFSAIDNPNIFGSSYILTIYGPASNPYLIISNDDQFADDTHININTEVPYGSSLVIDSTNKTVLKYLPDGSIINCFGARNIEAGYLWNRIPEGRNHITWDGSFDFDLKLVEERSEPKWLSD